MSNLVVPAVGAGIGWYVGGPTGAAVGWSIGAAVDADDPEQELPDLKVQTSQYGVSLAHVAGKQRVSGNIIWSTDKTIYDIEEGGKGGTIVGQGFRINMAIAICQGPILGISRVWEQGEIKADATGQTKLPGKLYLGSDTQLADATIEAHEGVGDVPAYRGIAYIVLTDFDLGSSGAIPQFTFEVVKDEAL